MFMLKSSFTIVIFYFIVLKENKRQSEYCTWILFDYFLFKVCFVIYQIFILVLFIETNLKPLLLLIYWLLLDYCLFIEAVETCVLLTWKQMRFLLIYWNFENILRLVRCDVVANLLNISVMWIWVYYCCNGIHSPLSFIISFLFSS